MKVIDIYRQIPGSNLSQSDFDLIDQMSSADYVFRLIDQLDIITNRHGWFIAQLQPNGTTAKVFVSLPANSSMDEVLQVLREIKAGLLDANGNGTGTKVIKAKNEDFLIDLGFENSGEYKGLFPLITIANAPKWLTDLLNTLTGHGILSLYIWLAISGVVASKVATSKKRNSIQWILLAFSLKMTYDSYRYKQDSNKKNQSA